jgi:hypothetical protein
VFVLEVMRTPHRPLEQKRRQLEEALFQIAGGGPTTEVERDAERTLEPPVDAPPAPETAVTRTMLPHVAIRDDSQTSRGRPPLVWALAGVVGIAALAAAAWITSDRSGAAEATTAVESPAAGDGFLRVSTEPPGAEVRVDGELWDERTPTIVASPGGVARRIEVALADHETVEREATATEGETVPVRVALARSPGRLIVRARPVGATVRLDGEAVGEAPLTLDDLPREAVVVTVEADGHAPYEEAAPLDVTGEHIVDVRLRRRAQVGFLDVSSRPWAQVRVDGRLVAESTPATGIRLPAGTHRVTLTNPTLSITKSRRVTIRPGETSRVVAQLR